MQEESYEVSGEEVDRLLPDVRNKLDPDTEHGDEECRVLVFEQGYHGLESHVLVVTVVLSRRDETTVRVDVVVGGGNDDRVLPLATAEERILDRVCGHLEAVFDWLDLTVTAPDGWSLEEDPDASDRRTSDGTSEDGRPRGSAEDGTRPPDRGRLRTSGADPDDRDLAYPGADAVVDPRCDVCGLTLEEVAFECDHCGGVFCRDHRSTDDHDCVGSVSFYTTIELDSD